MVLLTQSFEGQMRGHVAGRAGCTNPHVCKQRAARIGDDLLEAVGDVLDRLMVGRHSIPHQSVGHREPLVDVHVHARVVLEQLISRVEARRTAANDRDVPGTRRCG